VTVMPLFTIVIYGAIFEWRRMCTTLKRSGIPKRTVLPHLDFEQHNMSTHTLTPTNLLSKLASQRSLPWTRCDLC
jgi:hypothetical protein